jgi:hypothetical protein
MPRGRCSGLSFLLAGVLWTFAARASVEQFSATDTRGVGMGGATAAVVDGASAGLINPAALGFMNRKSPEAVDNNALGEQTFGWQVLGMGLDATLTGDLGEYLQALAGTDFSKFESPAIQNPENIESLISLAGALGSLNDDDTILANAHAGSLMQLGHFAVGVRTFGQIGGWVNDLDLVNLGLQIGAEQLADDIRQAIADDGFNPAGYEPVFLTGDSFQNMRDAFGGSATNDDVVAYLDFKMAELVKEKGADPATVKASVDILSEIIAESGLGANLSDNETSITGRGFIAVEFPISYGYAVNDNFAMGVTARAIFGRVYGTQVWAFNEDNEEILEDSLDSSVDRVNVGLDAAMMYRIPKWQFALVGHNLNRPVFEGYQQTFIINGEPRNVYVPDVVLDPQVSVGAAWFPLRRFLLSSEFDLLKTGTLLNGYDVQRISVGSELDLSLLVLRLGSYRNIAQGDLGWVLTGGVGFNLWAVSVDLAAAVSIDDTVIYDDMELPRTARLSAGFSMDF